MNHIGPVVNIANFAIGDLFDKILDGVWIVDGDFHTTYVNPSMAAMLGYPIERLLSSPVFSFWYPDDALAFERETNLCRAGQASQSELRFQHAEGHPIWTSITMTPLLDEAGGKFIGAVALLKDFTKDKHRSDIERTRLRLLQYAANHTLEQLLQAALDEAELLTGSQIGFFHFVEPDQQNLVLQMWSSNTLNNACVIDSRGQHYPIAQAGVWVDCVAERKPVIHNDYAALTHRKGLPDGHAPVIRELVVPVQSGERIEAIMGVGNKPTLYTSDDVGVVSSLAELAWDIARRKRVEEQLARSEERFRLLAQVAPVGIFMLNWRGFITYVNRRWCELTGIPCECALNQPWSDHIFPADLPRMAQLVRFMFASGGEQGIEYRYQHPDGKIIWVYGAAIRLESAEGRDGGFIGAIYDISARKEAEAGLQGMVAEKEALLRELYHRTKNNLQVVVSMIELQSASLEDEKVRVMLQELENKIQSMALVHKKLYQSKNLTQVNLEDYLYELVGLISESFTMEADRIQIKFDLEDVQAPVDVAIPCGLMINELLTNAFKYAFPNNRSGEIRLSLSQPTPGELCLQVADNGVGLPAGFDPRKNHASLGLQTVIALGEHQLGGRVTLGSQDGFFCQVEVPINRGE